MYKGAEFVGDTIESVLKQTYTNWEMIIVDDCSPDGGAGINEVKKYQDARIILVENKSKHRVVWGKKYGSSSGKGAVYRFLGFR